MKLDEEKVTFLEDSGKKCCVFKSNTLTALFLLGRVCALDSPGIKLEQSALGTVHINWIWVSSEEREF